MPQTLIYQRQPARPHGPAPEVYLDEQQENMLRAFESDGYAGLLDRIRHAEEHFAPDPANSRIMNATLPNWEQHALLLLVRLNTDVLRAVLTNTLPRRYQVDLHNEIRECMFCSLLIAAVAVSSPLLMRGRDSAHRGPE